MTKNSLTVYTIFFASIVISTFTQNTIAQDKLGISCYFSTRYEKQFETISSSKVIEEASPAEWTSPYFNVMFQHSLNDQFRGFINLNGSGAENIDLRNYWMEYSFKSYLQVRLGKIYRKFGLYNEILDAVPTYYGIEAPELFDTDHLMISRTTTLMLNGHLYLSHGTMNYSFSTDNGEGGSIKNTFPLGFDLNYVLSGGNITLGTSGYVSGGNAVPDKSVGEGSPKSGVLPWMSKDDFNVFGGYVELKFDNLLIQSEYWTSKHNALRDPASVLTIVDNAGLNQSQLARFLIDPSKDISQLTEADVIQKADFNIKTWYVRAGYSFYTNAGEIGPYLQWDWYSNPETIQNKTYGGDNEAGASDNGVFNKSTIGILYRPVPEVAVKLDQSYHFYKKDGSSVYYPEVRFDISYIFGN
jgi:hypothetical protein